MTAKEKIECLKKVFEDYDKILDAIDDVVGISPEAPLYEAISRLQNIAVRATAESIGMDPEVLDWFVIENSFGATPGMYASKMVSRQWSIALTPF